jgi:hypothetical protein
MSYSQNQLKALAQNNPKELARILTSPNADIHTLTYGAELLGDVPDERLVLPTLRMLLKHVNAVVREGAMMGLSSFYMERKPPQDVIEKLRLMNKADPSPSNKEFAETLLRDFEVLP